MTSPVLFLDIDGVLLSGRAWMLPSNRRLHEEAIRLPPQEVPEIIGREAVFDACAVALVNRICAASSARIVVCSSWRQSISAARIRAKLDEQGILDEVFHPTWVCGNAGGGRFDKAADIVSWLKDHDMAHGGRWLVLDDTDVIPGGTLKVDGREGLSTRDAAAAVRFFGASDSILGVAPLATEDTDRVIEAFGGDRVRASRWLEGSSDGMSRRHRPSVLLTQGRREDMRRNLSDTVGFHVNRWW